MEERVPRKSSAPSGASVTSEVNEAIVYCQDFENGDGGWAPIDRGDPGIFWHIDAGDWFCATEEDPCFSTDCGGGPGYGNNWDQRLSKSYTLPAGSVGLNLVHAYDTELSFDGCFVEVLPQGGTAFEIVAFFEGTSFGMVADFVDLGPYAGTTVSIRFRFKSDPLFSDEDGGFCSEGAWRIDRLQVTGYSEEDFTSELGWTPLGAAPPLATFRLESNPLCDLAPYLVDLGVTTLDCDHPSACEPPAAGNTAWVAYDPATGLIPLLPAGNERPFWVGIESPPIAIPPPVGTPEYRLEVDVFADQIFNSTRIVGQRDVAFPAPGATCYLRSNLFNTILSGPTNVGWRASSLNISTLVPDDATQIQVRLNLADWSSLVPFVSPGLVRGRGPYFDNIRIVHVTAPPGPPILECGAGPIRSGSCTTIVPVITSSYGLITRILDDTTPRGELIFNQDPPPGTVIPSGGFFSFSVTDKDGNTSESCQLQYLESVRPVIQCPGDVTLLADVSGQAVYAGPAATVTDNCDPSPTVSSDPPLPATFGPGVHTITYTATDAAANRSQCVQTVTVLADPAAAIDELIGSVRALLGDDRGLIRKLEEASEALARGKTSVAVNKLRDFNDQVAARVNSGALTQEQGDELTQAALDIIALIENGNAAKAQAPAAFAVGQNVPNPFNPRTTIGFSLPVASAYTLSIYDVAGRLVRTYAGTAEATTVSVTWDGTDEAGARVGSGLYFYKVQAGAFAQTKRMVLLK